jgi:hypothetical protein
VSYSGDRLMNRNETVVVSENKVYVRYINDKGKRVSSVFQRDEYIAEMEKRQEFLKKDDQNNGPTR